MYEEIRANRVIIGESAKAVTGEATLVVSLFQAENYLPLVKSNLEKQSVATEIVLIDNFSTDSTWETIRSWEKLFQGRLTLVRNPVNLGGWASLYLNLDLVRTDWFISMHQDDIYYKNHVEVLLAGISEASDQVVCIASDMGSLTNSGDKMRDAPPRASWGLPDVTRETLFLTNLRLHNLPNPSSAFRCSAFLEFTPPWHSTAFPDTEWLLKALLKNSVKFLSQVTVDYRENPLSDSHIVGRELADFGIFISLLRVFGSDDFVNFVRTVEAGYRSKFAKSVLESFEIRIGNPEFLKILSVHACEQMAFAWAYSEPLTQSVLVKHYSSLGAGRATDLLTGLANFHGIVGQALDYDTDSNKTATRRSVVPRKGRRLSFLLIVFNLLPRRLKIAIFGAIRKSDLISPTNPWFVNWRKRDN